MDEKTTPPKAPYHPWLAKAGGRRFLFALFLFVVTSWMRFHEKLSDDAYLWITIGIAGTYITGVGLSKMATAMALRAKGRSVSAITEAVDDSQQIRTLEEQSGLSEISDYSTRDSK